MSFFTAIFGKSATASSSASPAGGGSTARAPAASSSAGNGQRKLPAKEGSFTGEEAKLQIQTNLDLITSLTKKIEMDEERVKKEKLMAVEKNKAGNKTAAMAHLNTANKKQKEIDGLYNRKASLEEVVETIKRAELDRKYTQNLKAATAFMGKQQTDPDAAQDIMTDAEDAMRNANEVGQILSQQIGVDAVDEDELEQQLAAEMQRDLESSQAAAAGPASASAAAASAASGQPLAMPAVPRGPVSAASGAVSDEDQLAALMREMSGPQAN